MKRRLLAVFAALFALPVVAQQKLVESIEVRVVNVDVVVTDRSGKPVPGLTKDDFQLFENGRPQTITNLYEVRPEAGATVTPPAAAEQAPLPPEEMRIRRFVMFVDNYSLHPLKRNQVLKALDRFVETQMRPNDEAEIVLWAQSLRVITPFTTDKKDLEAGVARLSELSRSGMSIEDEAEQVKRHCQELLEAARDGRFMSMSQAFDECKASVSAHSDRVWSINKTLLEAMRLTMTTLSGLEGKKVMVFAGAHMPEDPGLELYMYITNLFQPYLGGRRTGSDMQGFATDRKQTFSIERLARQANADGVTMYMIDAADSRDKSSAERSDRTDTTEAFLEFTNTAMAFSTLANTTGGVALSNTSNFNAAFDAVARDLNSYYSLGYKPADDKPGDRRIVVKAKNAAYTVRSRSTYAPKTSEEQIKDRVVANIYHAGMKSDWPIEVHTSKPEPTGERFSVPIQVLLPATVTLLPQGEELVGGFTVYIAVGTDNGGMSKVTRSDQPIRIPKSAEADLRKKPMTFDATIVVRPGDSTLSIAAVDQISNATGLARARIAAR